MIIGINGYIGSGKDTIAKMIQYLTMRNGLGSLDGKFYPDRSYGGGTWQIRKFAYKLKQMASLLTGIPVEDLEKQEVKARELGPEWDSMWRVHHATGKGYNVTGEIFEESDNGTVRFERHKLTVRQLLQVLGTDAVRDKLHPNAWVNALMADYQPTGEFNHIHDATIYPNWVISDCRFPNEAQAIKDRGGVIWRINRGMVQDGKPIKLSGQQYHDLVTKKHLSETSLDNWDFDRTIENDDSLEELLTRVLEALKEGGFL